VLPVAQGADRAAEKVRRIERAVDRREQSRRLTDERGLRRSVRPAAHLDGENVARFGSEQRGEGLRMTIPIEPIFASVRLRTDCAPAHARSMNL